MLSTRFVTDKPLCFTKYVVGRLHTILETLSR